jgi:hypothetical protein
MNRFSSVLALAALAGALSVAATGCKVSSCDEGDACVASETLINYTGNDATASAPYSDGQGIAISGVNGDITVNVGGSEVKATFSPFTMDTDDQAGEDSAKNDLAKNLVLEVTAGDPVQVRVSKKDGGSSYLGADVVVTIPSSFNGAFSVAQNNGQTDVNLGSVSPTSTKVISDNGSVTVAGATGAIDIQADNGDLGVSISTWAEGGTGTVRAGLGDITISVPAEADGSISLFAPDGAVNASFPAEWVKEESAANSVTYTMDEEEGGAHLDVTAESLSDIKAETN